MKRLVVRIAALGTVVVLGWIAIAQAQRGAEHGTSTPAPAANSLPPAANSLPLDVGGVAKPIVAAGQPSAGLRGPVASSLPGVNPLRGPAGGSAAANEDTPARLPLDSGQTVAASEPASLQRSTGGGADPFLRPAGHNELAAVSAGAAAEPRLIPAENSVSDPPSQMPQQLAAAGSAYPGVSGPLASSRPMVEAVEGDRYAARQAEASAIPEPAPFRADPFSTPARITQADRYAADNRTAAAGTAVATAGSSDQGGFPEPAALAQGNLAPLEIGDASALPSSASSSASPQSASPAAAEGTGQPGSKQLEGPQTPQLTIQKIAPAEIQVGKPATFRVTVRNSGGVAASGVEVYDQVPKGTELVGTTPRATRGTRDELVWTLGTIKPGEESSVEMQVMPVDEGEIGSVATVCFRAEASARVVATKPQLEVKTSLAGQALIGEKVALTIEVSNPGSGVATGVVLAEHVPAGLSYPGGGESELEYNVGDLPPGESRKLELTLVANRPGPAVNLLVARGDGNLHTESRAQLEVVAPQLEVALNGPKRRYLEREATYELSVSNPGTAAAQQVELVAYLPKGLKFVSANNAGHYEETDQTVHWLLEELPSNETGKVELVTMPIEAGQQQLRLKGTTEKGLTAEHEQEVIIEGIAAILFQVADVSDPIEVGGETTYEIRVVNQGSKAATNVRVAVTLPPQMRPISAEGATRHVVENNRVVFEGLARLAPKADTTYRVRVQGVQPGDLRAQVQLLTDEMQGSPVTKEESTRVYSDQ